MEFKHSDDVSADKQHEGAGSEPVDYERLYDEAWRSEDSDAASLQEIPIDYLDIERNDCGHTVNNAITEVSNDFLSGKIGPLRQTKHGNSDESPSETEFRLVRGLAYVARYPESAAGMSDNDWNPYGTESDTNVSPRVHAQNGVGPKMSSSRTSSLTSFNPPLHSTDLNVNTPSAVMHSIPDYDSHAESTNGKSESQTFYLLQPDVSDFSSVSEEKQNVDLPKSLSESSVNSVDLNKTFRGSDPVESSIYTKISPHRSTESINGETESQTFYLLQPDVSSDYSTVSEAKQTLDPPKSLSESRINHVDLKTLRGSNLAASSIYTKRSSHRSAVDYNLLQNDLQDIEDNLHVLNPKMQLGLSGQDNTDSRQSREQAFVSLGSDCDIIPSTSVTPERQRNQMAWDYAADLGYQQPDGLMGDISLETFTTNSHRPSDEKKFNSDGDETRTSDNSDRIADHASVDQTLSETSQIIQPQTGNHRTHSNSVDQVLCNFENQRQQIESCYQQLNNPGLAEKVSRILANQDPQSQASGILSEVIARERQMRSQLIINPHRKDFDVSAALSDLSENNEGLAKPDIVRKRLDLSQLSSTEVSRLIDSSAVYMPARKEFAAFDDVARLLSSQMVKVSERTFNHSLEMVVPQRTLQCYPLTVDSSMHQSTRDDRPGGEVESTSDYPTESLPNWNTEADQSEHTSSPREIYAAQNEQSSNLIQSHDDSDSSSYRRREKYRPYKPAGSKEVYYTESDVASVADSATTMESTHFGSDDARGPVLPPSVLGSRQDVPNVPGIYGDRKQLLKQHGDMLPPIEEKPGLQDERESEASLSRKDNMAQESAHSHGKSPDAPSSFAEQEFISAPKKHDNGSRLENVSTTQSRSSRSVVEEGLAYRHSEANPMTVGSSAAGTSNGRWANSRNQQEPDIYELQRRNKSRDEMQNSENNNNLSQLSGQEFLPASRPYQRSHDYYNRPTDVSLHLQQSGTLRQSVITTQSSLRNRTPYDHDNRDKIDRDQKHSNPQVANNRGRSFYSTTDNTVHSPSRFHSESDGRHFVKWVSETNSMFSPQDPLSLPEQKYQEDIHKTLQRSHSDEDMYASRIGKHLSRKSLYPLSFDSRKTTEPVSSHHAERSVRLSAPEWSDHHQTNMRQTQSQPPSFLARERGQVPRSYTVNLRQPANPTGRNQEYSGTVSSLQSMDGFRTPGQFVNPADRQMVTREDMSPESDHAEFDHQPVSQRAQLLTQALSQGKEQGAQPDIDSLWEQFKASNESSETTLNTSSLEAVTDLILHPSPHLVTQSLKEREEELINRQEKAEAEREQQRAERLSNRRAHQSSSEEEMTGDYTALVYTKEEERMKRRAAKKKKGKSANIIEAEAGNCVGNLFSIAEDTNFEQTPNRCNSALSSQSSHVLRQPHVIDPNMKKLRERILKQKQTIDKSTWKEFKKIEKLKKLEQLRAAKERDEISDQTLNRRMEEISSASTPGSDESQGSLGKIVESNNTTPLSDDSTTAKDSSAEMHAWKMQKEMRIKMMKAKDTEQKNKYNSIKSSKYKGSLSSRIAHQGDNLEAVSSERDLLKLVAEGFLTAEEAYGIAVERELAIKGKSSHQGSYRNSQEDIYDSHNSRQHKYTSHVPNLMSAQSFCDVALSYPDSWYEHESQQNSADISARAGPHPHFRNEYIPSRTSQKPQLVEDSREWPDCSAPSIAKSTRQESIKYHGKSPPRSSLLNLSPVRQNRISPHRQQYPTRCEQRNSPSRSRSCSPRNKENNAKLRLATKKSTHHGSARHGKSPKPEKKPVLKQKSPDSGGIAWHIPLDVPQNKWKLSTTRRGMPLQERKLMTNTLSKKSREHSLHKDNLEPLQGWQMREEIDHENWHRPDHRPGISNELWGHDTLASKVNPRDVDPLMDRVQFILSKDSPNSSTEETTLSHRPLSKMSLQEALLTRKQGFISKCKERQKRLALAKKDRKMQECMRLEREILFMDLNQMTAGSLNAHPYSDNLYQPKRRHFSKQEMKQITMKRYKKLPEVLQKQESVKKMEQCQLNRLRADMFNRKIQRMALRKKSLRRR